MASPRLKRLAFVFLAVSFSLILSVGLAEVGVRYLAFDAHQRAEGAEQLWRGYSNEYLRPADSNGCGFSDSLLPHPFLSYAHSKLPPCGSPRVNNRGLLSKYDIPEERDPDHFSILLLGGSVASHLASPFTRIWLEDELNARFTSPTGKPFRVINGAAGGWAMPQQVIMASMHGSAVDALVAVDGYNEATHAEYNSVDLTDLNTYLMAAQPLWALDSIGMTGFISSFRRVALSAGPFKDSFLAFFAWERLLRLYGSRARNDRYRELTDALAIPYEWPQDRKNRFNRAKMKGYLRQLHAMSAALGIRYAHFLQPAPVIGKTLTAEERSHHQWISREVYENVFVRAYEELAREGLPVVSLVHVFDGIRGTIYVDHVHCKFEGADNPGYQLLSSRIAGELGRLWKLNPRAPAKPITSS